MPATPIYGIPWPTHEDPADGPNAIRAVAETVEDAFSLVGLVHSRRRTSNIAIPTGGGAGGGTKLIGPWEAAPGSTDDDRLFSYANGTWTVLIRGSYTAHVDLRWGPAAGSYRDVNVRVNGVEIWRTSTIGSNAGSQNVTLTRPLDLNIGDTYEIFVQQNTGGDVPVLGDFPNTASFMSITPIKLDI